MQKTSGRQAGVLAKKTPPASAEVVTFVFLLAQVKIPVADWECAFKRSGLVLPDGIAFRHTGQIGLVIAIFCM